MDIELIVETVRNVNDDSQLPKIVAENVDNETWDEVEQRLEEEWLMHKGIVFNDSKISIVELAQPPHEYFIGEFIHQCKKNDLLHMLSIGGGDMTIPSSRSRVTPDASIRPSKESMNAWGTKVLVDNTLVMEVGFSQRWSGSHGLDQKALLYFNDFPSVQYVLCVKIFTTENDASFHYKSWTRSSLWESNSVYQPGMVDFSDGPCILHYPWNRLICGNDEPLKEPIVGVFDKPFDQLDQTGLRIDLERCRDEAKSQIRHMLQ